MKRKIPVNVWEKIQPLIDSNKGLFIPFRSERFAFHFRDTDPDSDFYFVCEFQDPTGQFDIHYKPQSKNILKEVRTTVNLDDLVHRIGVWGDAIKAFQNLRTYYDDPIVDGYQEEFVQNLEFVDSEEDEKPFSWNDQLFLDQYLTKVKELSAAKIEEGGPGAVDKNELNLIQSESDKLKKQLPKLSKLEFRKRLMRIWARARKVGIDFFRDVAYDLLKEGMLTVARNANNPDLLEGLKGFLRLSE